MKRATVNQGRNDISFSEMNHINIQLQANTIASASVYCARCAYANEEVCYDDDDDDVFLILTFAAT